MQRSLQDFCDTGVPSPLCENPANWFGINSYELGFNENMEQLPISFSEPSLNPFVRNIPVAQSAALPVTTSGTGTTKTNALLTNNLMQSFSLSNFIQANPILSLVIGLGLGYLALKAVK